MRERNRNAVSSQSRGQLYMTYKQNPTNYLEMEIE